MGPRRIQFHEMIEKYGIGPSCMYNRDQTGLFNQKNT